MAHAISCKLHTVWARSGSTWVRPAASTRCPIWFHVRVGLTCPGCASARLPLSTTSHLFPNCRQTCLQIKTVGKCGKQYLCKVYNVLNVSVSSVTGYTELTYLLWLCRCSVVDHGFSPGSSGLPGPAASCGNVLPRHVSGHVARLPSHVTTTYPR